jgi:hypothetical protein
MSGQACSRLLPDIQLFRQKFSPKRRNNIAMYLLQTGTSIQGDQKVSVHLIITVQKTSKNILNILNHLP